jgi:hypothetical protein
MTDYYRLALTLVRILRGLLQRVWWLRWRMAPFLKDVIQLAFAVAAANWIRHPLRAPDYGEISLLVSLFLLAKALFSFLSFTLHKVVIEPNPEASNIELTAREPEVIFTSVGQSLWTNRRVNDIIDQGSNSIKYVAKLRDVDPLIKMFLPQFILGLRNEDSRAGLETFDEKKLGLRTDISFDLVKRNGDVLIQRSSYFRDRLSNGLLKWRVPIGGRVSFDFVRETFEPIRSSAGTTIWHLKSLSSSNLSNQLGASVLLLTCDGYVVYLTQAGRSAENRDKLAPSGSGSFDADRIGSFSNKSLQEFVRAEIKRELTEECGLSLDDIHNVQICGFGRYIYRAGKPEFFCVASTPKMYAEIEVPIRELDWQHKYKSGMVLADLVRDSTLEAFRDSITRGLVHHAVQLEANHTFEPVSGPLLWNIRMAVDYLNGCTADSLRLLLSPLSPPQ